VRNDRHVPTVDRGEDAVLNVLALTLGAVAVPIPGETVRIWRAPDDSRVLLMAGRTRSYAMEPRGEYVFGVTAGAPMRAQRGRERYLVSPGQLLAFDPSAAHAGSLADGRAWFARLIVVEVGDLAVLAGDHESPGLPVGVCIPNPMLDDPGLAADFVRLHRALDGPATRLERDVRLAEWLHRVVTNRGAHQVPRPGRTPRDERALRLARDYLADRPEHHVGLDELAGAAGIGKFRLVRLFREQTGLPPYAFQIAHRIRRARRLLEAGQPIASVAASTGFADQSHLHRYFQRSLGITPLTYQRRSVS
jgi:AraC-like DNA-binding protein